MSKESIKAGGPGRAGKDSAFMVAGEHISPAAPAPARHQAFNDPALGNFSGEAAAAIQSSNGASRRMLWSQLLGG